MWYCTYETYKTYISIYRNVLCQHFSVVTGQLNSKGNFMIKSSVFVIIRVYMCVSVYRDLLCSQVGEDKPWEVCQHWLSRKVHVLLRITRICCPLTSKAYDTIFFICDFCVFSTQWTYFTYSKGVFLSNQLVVLFYARLNLRCLWASNFGFHSIDIVHLSIRCLLIYQLVSTVLQDNLSGSTQS